MRSPTTTLKTIFGVTLALLVGLLALAPATWAADQPLRPAGVLMPLKVGVSPVLRNMDLAALHARANKTEPGAPATEPRELNSRNAELPENLLKAKPAPAGEDPAVQRTYGPNAMPPAIMNFEGVGNVNGVLPPDTNGDVGVDYYVQWVNLSFDIFDKTTGVSAIGGPVPGNSLWTGFGGSCESDNYGDPIVLYDHLAGRWFMSQFTGDNHQCIAVSQTGDPTGAWYLYDYLADAGMGAFPDYPKFGVWPDGYYYTANMFTGSFQGAMAGVFERDQMLLGQPAQFIWFFTADSNSFPSYSMLPADLDGANLPPAGAANPFVELVDDAWGYDPPYDQDEILVIPMHVDWATPANSTFGPETIVDMTAAGYPFDTDMCGYSRNCIPQPGTSQGLDAMSSRLMYRLQYRNFGGYQTLVTSHTVDEDGSDHAGVRWYELRDSGAGWGVNQAGTYAPDSDHRWMADAAMDASGDMAVGYSVSSSTTYPSIRWAGRLPGDPAGTLAQGEDTVIAGAGSQTHSAARWGDYSSMSVDPVDDCTFWYTTEYMPSTGTAPWQTRIASFKFPSCSTGPTGTIQGTVTNSATGDPIDGATVQVGGFSTSTNGSGFYTITIPTDTYDVTASKFGFVAQTVTGIVVGDGDVITQDFVLDPAGTAFIDGYVTGDVHGWPLYARINVSLGAAPVATVFTNPFNGYYEIELPQGMNYDLDVTSLIDGYVPATRTVALGPSGSIESFALANDGSAPWVQCTLDGGVVEDFEGDFPPGGWVAVDNIGSGHVWMRNDQLGSSNRTGGTGFDAAADSDATCGGGPWDTTLYSPLINLPATPAKGIRFNSNFQDYAGSGQAWFDISSDGGATWTNLWYSSVDDPGGISGGGVLRDFDISAYAGMQVQFRWRYTDDGDGCAWFWHIDNVSTYPLPPPPPTPILTEAFEGSFPPTGWTVVDNLGGGPVWDRNDAFGVSNRTNGSGFSAAAEAYTSGVAWNTSLLSPAVDLTGTTAPHIVFESNFQDFAGNGDAWLDITTDGGSTWTNLYYSSSDDGPNQKDIDLTSYAGSTVQFRWTYEATSSTAWYWHIDDVTVGDVGTPPGPEPTPTLTCEPVGGALVEGFVTDANTMDAINGASVTDDLGGATTTVATPDDPAIGDGFYWMFTPLNVGNGPSTRTFTASASGYADSVVSANLSPDAVNQIDHGLAAGWLEVTPAHLVSRLYAGQTEHQNLDIINHGGVDANVLLIPIVQAATWPHAAPEFDLGNLPGSTEPTSMGRAPHPAGPIAATPKPDMVLAGPPAFGVDVYPGGNLVSWTDVTDVTNWTVVAGGMGSYFGGDFYMGDFSKLYVLDYNSNTLGTVDTSSGAFTAIGSAVPGGGESWTGLSAAVDGTMYASATTCSSSTLYTIDPADGTVTTVGTVTNAPCLIDIAINAAGELYGVDIVNDNLVQIDPATGAGTIVGSLGVNANYAQGLDFDEVSGTLYWAAYSSSGELRVIDTATGASTLVGAFPGGAEVDAFAIQTTAGGGGLPWLVLTPTDGVVPANEGTLPIDAQFIADGASHYGLYRANITVVHDTPYDVNPVTVCFTKAFNDVPPGYWADAFIHSLAGAEISYGCGAGNFCPTDLMTRGVMARWLLRAKYGPAYSPPPCTGIFADVICESTPNSNYIEALYNEGITAGCDTDPLRYCPDSPVTRAQMSVFLLAAKEGTGYTPPPCTGIFTDVPCGTHWAADWVEELFNRGITAGCGPNIFCPDDTTSREQMSVFMTVNWSLPMCDSGS